MCPDDETSRLAAMPDLLRLGNRERRVADDRLNQLGEVRRAFFLFEFRKRPQKQPGYFLKGPHLL